jgi:hypothetical protein
MARSKLVSPQQGAVWLFLCRHGEDAGVWLLSAVEQLKFIRHMNWWLTCTNSRTGDFEHEGGGTVLSLCMFLYCRYAPMPVEDIPVTKRHPELHPLLPSCSTAISLFTAVAELWLAVREVSEENEVQELHEDDVQALLADFEPTTTSDREYDDFDGTRSSDSADSSSSSAVDVPSKKRRATATTVSSTEQLLIRAASLKFTRQCTAVWNFLCREEREGGEKLLDVLDETRFRRSRDDSPVSYYVRSCSPNNAVLETGPTVLWLCIRLYYRYNGKVEGAVEARNRNEKFKDHVEETFKVFSRTIALWLENTDENKEHDGVAEVDEKEMSRLLQK